MRSLLRIIVGVAIIFTGICLVATRALNAAPASDDPTAGLNLGTPYTVPGYPAGDNAATGLPWAPATDGLRNLTGRVNPNGTVTIWAVTSTVSGGGDQGADPNQLVEITDPLNATAPASWERFRTVIPARYDQVVRGVSFTPGSLLLAGY